MRTLPVLPHRVFDTLELAVLAPPQDGLSPGRRGRGLTAIDVAVLSPRSLGRPARACLLHVRNEAVARFHVITVALLREQNFLTHFAREVAGRFRDRRDGDRLFRCSTVGRVAVFPEALDVREHFRAPGTRVLPSSPDRGLLGYNCSRLLLGRVRAGDLTQRSFSGLWLHEKLRFLDEVLGKREHALLEDAHRRLHVKRHVPVRLLLVALECINRVEVRVARRAMNLQLPASGAGATLDVAVEVGAVREPHVTRVAVEVVAELVEVLQVFGQAERDDEVPVHAAPLAKVPAVTRI